MSRLLIDTHTHYDNEAFEGDRDSLLPTLVSRGIAYVVNMGYDIESSKTSRDLAARYDFIWFAAGIHPHDAAGAPPDFEKAIAEILNDGKAVALGEIGLDYHYDYSPREKQREVFARQISLAGGLGMPVVIHDRDAHADIIDILSAHKDELRGGVCHCFSGDRRLAGQALELGLYIAFGGALTFKNSREIADAAAYTPSDRLLLETDCPYLSPAPYRGRRNDSTRLGIIAERVAQIRGADVDEIAKITAENAKKLFSIP